MNNNIRRMPLAAPPPEERKAEALAEIQSLYAEYEDAAKENERLNRALMLLQDKVAMLEEQLREERDRSRVCERKLIRLAANQRNISRIAQDGDEIMRSVQDWQEQESTAGQLEEGVREILERIPQSHADEGKTVPPINTP